MTTLENEYQAEGRLGTDPETRMTMNFARETVAFDNKQFDLEDELLKQKE